MAKLTPQQKAAKTRARNALKKRRERQAEFAEELRQQRKDRIERAKLEEQTKALKKSLQYENDVANGRGPLMEYAGNVKDDTIASRLKQAIQDDELDKNSRITNSKELYKDLVKRRAWDIKTEEDAEKFIKDIKQPDKFMKDLKSIPAYAKSIKNYVESDMLKEADEKQRKLSDVQVKRNMDDLREYNDGRAGGASRTAMTSMAANILTIAATNHSAAAAMAIAADVGSYDDPRIHAIKNNHNYAKYGNPRSIMAEEYIELRQQLEFAGITSSEDIGQILNYMMKIEGDDIKATDTSSNYYQLANDLHRDGLSIKRILAGMDYSAD